MFSDKCYLHKYMPSKENIPSPVLTVSAAGKGAVNGTTSGLVLQLASRCCFLL